MKQSVPVGKLVQIHDVPDRVHRELKLRAARRRVSLSALLRGELERLAGAPDLDQVLATIAAEPPLAVSESPAAGIRRIREGGEER